MDSFVGMRENNGNRLNAWRLALLDYLDQVSRPFPLTLRRCPVCAVRGCLLHASGGLCAAERVTHRGGLSGGGPTVALRLQHLNILAQHAHPRVFKWSLYIIFKVRSAPPIRGTRCTCRELASCALACLLPTFAPFPPLLSFSLAPASIRHTLSALRPSWPCCSPTSLPTLACHLPGMCAQPAPRNAA